MALDTNKQYSPNDLAKYVGSANDAWNGKEFFVDGEKYKIIDNGNGSRRVQKLNPTAGDIKSGQAFGGNTKQILVNEISKQLIELEDRLGQIPNVTFTTEELDAFMNKAIAEITPYYDKKKEEIEKGIKEGKIQTAEDTLALIERVKMDVQNNFAKYDIDQAQTEEEFINRLADITASSNEATDTKRFEWKQRLQDARIGQVQKNIFTSGVGQKQITDLETRKQQELKAIERQTGQALTETNTTKKFSLDRIALARQAITDERKRRIGEPTQTDALEAQARADIGLTADQQIGSEADIAYNRAQRNTKVYDPTALSSLEEERRAALEKTNLDIKQNEEDIRNSEYEAQRKKILAEQSRKQLELNSYLR